MRFRVISAFCAGGGRDLYAGEEHEAADLGFDDAWVRVKVGQGFVALVETPAPVPDEAVHAEVELGEPVQATPRRRRRGRKES